VNIKEILIGVFLVGIGCVQMVGDLVGSTAIKAFGAALAASPAPKVFTAQDGFETYANRFYLEWHDASGALNSMEVTPARYAVLAGPYNRRNVYGAAISYAPVLYRNPQTRPMFLAVLRNTLCTTGSAATELGVPEDAAVHGPLAVRIEPRRAGDNAGYDLVHQVDCHDQ
jgi:hypothetical protein